MVDAFTSSTRPAASQPANDIAHALRFVLEPGETILWAERPRGSIWPTTWLGWTGWLVGAVLLGAGVWFATKALGQPSAHTSFFIAFFVVWEGIVLLAVFFTVTRLSHAIYALTDLRVFSIDTRIPISAYSFWKTGIRRYCPLKTITLIGPKARPTICLSSRLFGAKKAFSDLPGIAAPREAAELIRRTLDIQEVEDHTR